MASTTGFHVVLLLGLAPTGIHDRKDALASRNLASTFSTINLLFTKLFLRPKTNSKPRSKDLIV
jgi:hypothetical protein